MVDILTGVPSIVAGLFIYALWVTTFGFQRVGFAVCLALVLLMIPVVVRSTEEMLKLVPNELREASYALGVPKWKTIMKVVLPTAFSGIVTGILLGLARVMGETAPLLILGPYTKSIATDLFSGLMPTLPTMINQDRTEVLQPAVDRMWATALTLILLVLAAQPRRPRRRALRLRQEVARPRHTARTPTSPNSRKRRTNTLMAKRIDVSDLNVYYGAFKAVEGVTMTVEPRSVTAFIGPSGCGKSTFLRTLNRMHEVIPGGRVEGKVMLDDQDLYALERRPGGRAPHGRHGVPAAEPVPDDVDLRQRRGRAAAQRRQGQEASSTRSSRSRCTGANLWNEVKDRLDKPGAGLSGGQQQRLCIARAIAVEPQVLLMDEPCSALDPISTLAIEDLIGELKSKYTIVIVTHNMQQAARVSDRTAFFNLAATGKPGRLIEIDDTQQDLQQPQREGHRGLHLRPLRLTPARPAVSATPCRRARSSRPTSYPRSRFRGRWRG